MPIRRRILPPTCVRNQGHNACVEYITCESYMPKLKTKCYKKYHRKKKPYKEYSICKTWSMQKPYTQAKNEVLQEIPAQKKTL